MIEKIRDLFSNVPYLHNKWIQAAIVIFLFIILAKVVHFVFAFYLKRFAKKTKTKADDMIFSKIKWPLFFLILFYLCQSNN